MKRMKKVFAMLLALAMIMGLNLTTFAADKYDIPVSGANGATFKHAQLIELDTTKETGWDFVNTTIEATYVSALNATDGQDAITKLINKVNGAANAASDGQIAAALRAIKNSGITLVDGKEVEAPGVYYIDAQETGYVYNPMAAYVSFGLYVDGVPTGLVSTGTVAKKADDVIVKTNNNGDAITEISKEVTYTIATTVPYIAYDNNGDYKVIDTISGAEFKLTDGKMIVDVKVGTADSVKKEAALSNNGKTFTLNLNEYAKDANRIYAGQDLVITYKAVVTSQVIKNEVVANDGNHTSKVTVDELGTANATIVKKDVTDQTPLAGASFVLKKGDKFAELKEIEGGYELVRWVDTLEEADYIVTAGEEGKATVYGLDSSETYVFVEEIAPTGYSVNETPAAITWNGTVGSAEMLDSKLSALPSTGGIGTAAFTIGGCAIMIAAAYFFFVNRKKES